MSDPALTFFVCQWFPESYVQVTKANARETSRLKAPSTCAWIFLDLQLFLFRYGFRPHASSEFGSKSGYFWIRSPEMKKITESGYFLIRRHCKSCPFSYRTINQYGRTTCRSSFSRLNPDTVGCVWTGGFDLNTIPVQGEIFESGKIKKYPDTSGRCLKHSYNTG